MEREVTMGRSELRKQKAIRSKRKRKQKLSQHNVLNILLIFVSVCIVCLLINLSLR